jgi:glutamyl-tRNA synthetase
MAFNEGVLAKIRECVLENAIKFEAKASSGAVVGKVLAFDNELKSQMKDVMAAINAAISEINKLSLEQQKSELIKLNPNFELQQQEKKKENKEKRSDLPELKDAVDGKVVMRISPEPSKYNHIGHAISFLLNYMYAQRYHGKCLLRFDDTNPEKSTQEYVDAMKSDVLEYLGISVDETYYASDNVPRYVEYADKLVADKKAYVCNCPSETISALRREMKDCHCRSKSISEVKKTWEEMKLGNNKEFALRMRVDMAHKNAVMRDPVIFRIIDVPHYRQGTKFKVWPMYDFEGAIEDARLSHVLRSNEFESRIELQDYIRNLFGLPSPIIKQYGRYQVADSITQGREIREKVVSGEYIGWDDPRLVTLRALKRRGIVRDAFYDLAKVVGMSKAGGTLDFSVIAAINRKILDEKAKRFFFIQNPVKIKISGAPNRNIKLDMHPDQDLGKRIFSTNEEYIIEKKDFDVFKKGEFVRLIDNFNFIFGKDCKYISDSYMEFKEKGKNIIHFLPGASSEHINVEIRMPDNSTTKGIAEKSIVELKIGEVVQFQRFGFCRLDAIDGKTFKFWYTHE